MVNDQIVISKNGIPIRLTLERWAHIIESHDYMAGNQDLVLETVESPDYIIKGEKDEIIVVKHYDKTSISEKYLVVIYKESQKDGFVITSFMTTNKERLLKKEVLWPK